MRMNHSCDSGSIDLQSLRAVLGGEITGGQLLCPGPGHSPRDRSLAVKLSASGGFVVHSFAGDDWRECRGHVHARLGLPQWRSHNLIITRAQASSIESNKNVESARRLWSEGADPRGTSAEAYLAARKLHLPAEQCGSVFRFHPQCPWRIEDKIEFIPCLIAAFTCINDNEITAIHRIRVDRLELWPKTERRMLGAVAGTAIMLDPPGQRLAIAEGIESALAARQLGFGATWALGSARELAPIDGVNELIILGERDEASRKAADACARLWQAQERAVSLVLPAYGGDFNDLLMGAR
jgi:hypothetical protein